MTAPSYEQLAALVAAQERIIAQLQARIAEQDARLAEQEARIAELERQLAADNRIGTSTGYRYLHEGIDALAAHAPGLRGALLAARAAGHPHVHVEGTLIRTDRCWVPGPTVRRGRPDTRVDLWWSGKHRAHGGNIQSSPPRTAGRSGPRRCGPAASMTPPRCAPTPRCCRHWPSEPTRSTPPSPTWATRANTPSSPRRSRGTPSGR